MFDHRIHTFVFATFAAIVACMESAQAQAPAQLEKTTLIFKTVGDIKIAADVYRPSGNQPRPVVVWIHGGGMIVGSRTSVPKNLLDFCTQQQVILVSLDYRLAPEVKLADIAEDIRDAFVWLHAKGPAEFQADTSRIVVAGGSAGGCLAMLAGAIVRPRPTALVTYWGYGDIDNPWASTPSQHHGEIIRPEDVAASVGKRVLTNTDDPADQKARGSYYRFVRQTGQWAKQVAGLDPAVDAKKIGGFCALRLLKADYPPILMIHGTTDTDVPYSSSADMARELAKLSVKHELITVPNAEHGLRDGDPRHVAAAHARAFRFISRSLGLGSQSAADASAGGDASLASRLKGVTFTKFAEAPGYSEGPTWRAGELFFCSGALLRVDSAGNVEKYRDINPAGTVLCNDGRLLICDNKHKALLQMSRDGKLAVLADQYDGQSLNSLNDLTIDTWGNVYWTDPSGSSAAKPVGNVFCLTPDGSVTKVATGLAFPNGLDVDPESKHLYVIESQSKKVLRYALPAQHGTLGSATTFYDLGGSGGDGCAFDAEGNLWVADFHRPETKQGRITILSPTAQVMGQIDVPAKVVSNIAFGGPKHDEIYCTTGDPPGVFRAAVGVVGFRGHPGRPMKVLRALE